MAHVPTGVLDILGQEVMPEVFGSLNDAGITETMDILRRVVTAGTGGGRIKGSETREYRDIPVTVNVQTSVDWRTVAGEKAISVQEYILIFATHIDGERIDIDTKGHRLKVLARGNESDKYFRIKSIRDKSGVIFEAVCEREN